MIFVLLRLACLAVTHAFAFLRLLPMSDREEDVEILALRRQLLVLQRQVGKPTFTDTDRAVLAGLLHHLPMDKLRHLLLLVRPDTLLRWHRDLLKRRHAAACVAGPHLDLEPEPPSALAPRVRDLLRLPSTAQSPGTSRAAAPLPAPINVPEQIGHLEVRRRDRLGGTLHEYQPAA
ncbi:hypothetical protein [Streptomyces mirabilis]